MAFLPDPATVTSQRIAAMTDYWHRLKGDRCLPLRSDLNPAEIKPLLPSIMLVDLESEPFRVRYRLVGTEVVTWSKVDFTGRYLDELDFKDLEKDNVFTDGYRAVRASGLPHYARIRTFQLGEQVLYYECAIYPLTSDGATIDQAVAIEDYANLSPEHLQKMPPSSLR